MKLLLRNTWFWLFLSLFIGHQILERLLHIRIEWLDNYLDDLLCMPILLGGWLAEQYDLFGRKRLRRIEIFALWVVVSLVFEGLLPYWSPRYTADGWDAVCYALGSWLFYRLIQERVEQPALTPLPERSRRQRMTYPGD